MSGASTTIDNLGALVDRRGDPDRPVFVGFGPDEAEVVLTRADLDATADAFARGLLRGGLVRGDRIAILAANHPKTIALLLGAMRAGLIPTPINHKFPVSTVTQVIADCGARLLVCDAAQYLRLPTGLAATIRIAVFDREGVDGLDAWLDPGPFEAIRPADDEAALCLYTSGSTGRPKGVMLGHAAHLWVVRTRSDEAELRRERLLIAAPLYHMNALALALLVCASGSSAVLLPQFEARRYIAAVERYGCTWLTAVPPMMAMMLREKDALAEANLSSVRTVRMGSAPVSDALAAEMRMLLPNARIINAYGTTEGGPIVFTDDPSFGVIPPGSVGRPHPEVPIRLVGPDAPDLGELQLKSPAIMLGYLNRPDTPSPITPDGYYRTGDIFRCDAEGFYTFVGRADDMFVSGGENIFPGEVETVIETHPDVLQACVVPVADVIKGTKPVAYVVRRPGATVTESEIKHHVLANAPAYQHPRHVWFLDTMLLAASNKIDRNALRARAEMELEAR